MPRAFQERGRYVKRAKACQDADAIKQDHHDGTSALAPSRTSRALTLGCADNDLAGVRRQCFYLALPLPSCQTLLMLLGTPTLYLEHSAVSNEAWWPQIDAVLATGQVRLALS